MKITVSAPGKVYLLGEHAVVYGRPALIASLNKRLYVEVRSQRLPARNALPEAAASLPAGTHNAPGGKVRGQNNEKIIINTSEKDDLARYAISVFKKAFSISTLPPMEITITSSITPGSGLGSSAALAAATIGALMKFIKNIWNPEKINELAFTVEKIAHGFPSGADNTAVTFGGLVWFRREFDFLKSIWSLPVSSYKMPKFLLIDSGRPCETTKEMVDMVGKLYRQKRKMFEGIMYDQEIQVKRLLLSLRNGNFNELRGAIRQGERNLEKIDVVGNFAKKIIREIEEAGGAAKICGAGGKREGSGMLLVYHQDLAKIYSIGHKYNLSVSPAVLGKEGIRIENKPN